MTRMIEVTIENVKRLVAVHLELEDGAVTTPGVNPHNEAQDPATKEGAR